MSDELKPCPFCGARGVAFDGFVDCENEECGSQAASPSEWNTRPIEDALRAEIERLRGLLRDAYEYGGHQEGCSARFNDAPDNPKYRCRCGWDEDGPRIAAALAALDKEWK